MPTASSMSSLSASGPYHTVYQSHACVSKSMTLVQVTGHSAADFGKMSSRELAPFGKLQHLRSLSIGVVVAEAFSVRLVHLHPTLPPHSHPIPTPSPSTPLNLFAPYHTSTTRLIFAYNGFAAGLAQVRVASVGPSYLYLTIRRYTARACLWQDLIPIPLHEFLGFPAIMRMGQGRCMSTKDCKICRLCRPWTN